MLSEVQRLLHPCVCLLFFWLSEPTLSRPVLAWKYSLSLHQGPRFCSQPKALLPKLLLFHTALTTSYLLIPLGSQRHLHEVHHVLLFSISLIAVFAPLSYPVPTALVQPPKPFLFPPVGFSFVQLASPCSCHSSCSHWSPSLPQYMATLPPVAQLKRIFLPP